MLPVMLTLVMTDDLSPGSVVSLESWPAPIGWSLHFYSKHWVAMASILEKITAHLQTHRMQHGRERFATTCPRAPATIMAQRAHARLYSMIHATGVRVDEAGKEHYAFFERDLFGIDEPWPKRGIF